MSSPTDDTFKVWADDDTAYGPVDAATLAGWIDDNRVFPDSFVQPQSGKLWRQAVAIDGLRDRFTADALAQAESAPAGEVSPAAVLGEFDLFAGLPDHGLEQLAELGRFYEAATGTQIVSTGDPCDAVYFVIDGQLRVRLLVGAVDRQDKTLCKLGRGEFFGELGMFLQSTRTADVVAETDAQLFRITTNAFRLLVRQLPDLAAPVLFNLGATMAQRIAEDNQRFYREVTSQFLWS